jgi:AcrR family transcriptional regulator
VEEKTKGVRRDGKLRAIGTHASGGWKSNSGWVPEDQSGSLAQKTARPEVADRDAARPRRLTGAQRQRSIVYAAAEVFARRGYDAARIDEIAAAAGVSKALIYEHFKGKRELYAHIMRNGTEESLRRVLEASALGQNSVQRLQRGLSAFLDFVAEQPTVWRVIEQEVSDPEIIALDQSQQTRSEDAIAQLLASDEKIAPQDLSPEDLKLLAVMINGASVRAANWWIENPSVDQKNVLASMMRFMWLGLERIRNAVPADPSAGNGSVA